MTEITIPALRELKAKAEAAQSAFEEGEKALYRGDGAKIYGDAEHEERLSALRAERNQVLSEVEQGARVEVQAAQAEITNLEHRDPTELLSADELERANAKRGFANDAAESLGLGALTSRLESVLAGSDRAAIFAYWQAGQRKREGILARRRERATSGAAEGTAAAPLSRATELDDVLARMREVLDEGKTAAAIEAAKARISAAVEVELRAGYGRQGARSAAEAYANRHHWSAERLGPTRR